MRDIIPSASAAWPGPLAKTVRCDADGFVLGAETPLIRAADGRFAVAADGARCLALLSVLCRRPVGSDVLRSIEAAAAYWAAGDKALANLRLVFAGLPKVGSLADAARLQAAAFCLDHGLAPRDLMTALDLDPSVLDVVKFDPNEPRVPAGSGEESGRWTEGFRTGPQTADKPETRSGAVAAMDWKSCHERCLTQTVGTWPSSDRPGLYRRCMRECLGGNY